MVRASGMKRKAGAGLSTELFPASDLVLQWRTISKSVSQFRGMIHGG